MAKYDCTKTKDFLHELKRAKECCRKMSLAECKESEMVCRNGGCFVSLARNLDCIPERQFDYAIEKIQKWSDGHLEPQKRDLTEDERNILKAFKALGFKYIAADKDGCVVTYTLKPQKEEKRGWWYIASGDYRATAVCRTGKFFGDILSYDDEEPAEIEKLLEGDK